MVRNCCQNLKRIVGAGIEPASRLLKASFASLVNLFLKSLAKWCEIVAETEKNDIIFLEITVRLCHKYDFFVVKMSFLLPFDRLTVRMIELAYVYMLILSF